MKMFYYLISSGVYSDYDVLGVVAHEKNLQQKELDEIIEETKEQYIKQGLPTENYTVNNEKLSEVFYKKLKEKGFKEVAIVGEFHLTDYSILEDMSAYKK